MCLQRKPFLLLFFTVWVLSSFSQTTREIKPQTDYLLKSKHQKNAAIILLCSGVATMGIGVEIVTTANTDKSGYGNGIAEGGVIAVAGAITTLTSIPFFINATHNKHKAATLSFEKQNVPALFKNNLSFTKIQPAITLKIPL